MSVKDSFIIDLKFNQILCTTLVLAKFRRVTV